MVTARTLVPQQDEIETIIARMKPTPSPLQADFYRAIAKDTRNLILQAVAGSGKSTTVIEALRFIPTDHTVLYLCYNKHASEDLKAKLRKLQMQGVPLPKVVDVKTTYAYGLAVIRAQEGMGATEILNEDQGRVFSNEYIRLNPYQVYNPERRIFEAVNVPGLPRVLRSLVDMARKTLTSGKDVKGLKTLVEKHDMKIGTDNLDPIWQYVCKAVETVLGQLKHQLTEQKQTDLTGEVWGPALLGWTIAKYDDVVIDECQDLSKPQRILALSAGRRIVAVGDPHQAINQFAGSDEYSFDAIREETKAVVLPLSVCYRCGQDIVKFLQYMIEPLLDLKIDAFPGSPKGSVQTIYNEEIANLSRPGDIVLSRYTRPLMETYQELIRLGKPARIRGKNIAEAIMNLASIVQEQFPNLPFTMRDEDLFRTREETPTYIRAIDTYSNQELQKLQLHPEENEAAIELFSDRIRTLELCADVYVEQEIKNFYRISFDGFMKFLRNLFDAYVKPGQPEKPAVELRTIHGAKGAEADVIFILDAHRLPAMRKSQTPEQYEAECNVLYVGLSRAKKTLYYCVSNSTERGTAKEMIEDALSSSSTFQPRVVMIEEVQEEMKALPAPERKKEEPRFPAPSLEAQEVKKADRANTSVQIPPAEIKTILGLLEITVVRKVRDLHSGRVYLDKQGKELSLFVQSTEWPERRDPSFFEQGSYTIVLNKGGFETAVQLLNEVYKQLGLKQDLVMPADVPFFMNEIIYAGPKCQPRAFETIKEWIEDKNRSSLKQLVETLRKDVK